MTAELHVLTGDRAGLVVALSGGECTLGRHARCTLRFAAEPGVSARHARIVRGPAGWRLHDLCSTNHTWLNGRRVDGPADLRDGDRIVLGPGGPVLEVRLSGPPAAARGARGRPDARARRVLLRAALATTACVAGAAAALRMQRSADAPHIAPLAPAAAHHAPADTARPSGSPAASAAIRPDAPPARGRGGDARAGAPDRRAVTAPSSATPDRRAETAPSSVTPDPRGHGSDATPAGARAAAAAGGRTRLAVARIWVEGTRGEVWTGTAFSVRADGALVTSRHVAEGEDGDARRIAVQFTASTQVWRARLVAVSRDWDLALVKIDGIAGEVPAVRGLNLRPDTLAPGAPVTLLGFPGGGAAEPGRPARPVRSMAEFGSFRGRVEVYARSAAGASGSPLFDAEGNLLGVLFGGNPRAPRPVLYAVPAAAVARLMENAP